MKKIYNLLGVFCLVLCVNVANCQVRIQSIAKGISLLGIHKNEMSDYLAKNNFSFSNSSGNISSYVKRVAFGENTYMVACNNMIVETIAWTEHLSHLNNIVAEVKEQNLISAVSSRENQIYSFRNTSKNLLLTLIIREDMNNVQITIGKINPLKPFSNNSKKNTGESASSKIKFSSIEDKPISKTNISSIKTPNDIDIYNVKLNALNKNDLLSASSPWKNAESNSPIYGVITDVKKDNLSTPIEIRVFYKDSHYPNGTYEEITVKDHDGFGSTMTNLKLTYLKEVLVPGRKIKFSTIWIGSSAGYNLLTYIASLPKNTKILFNKVD